MLNRRTLLCAALAPLLLAAPLQAQYPHQYPQPYPTQYPQPYPQQALPPQGLWPQPPAAVEPVTVYRVHNPRTGEHRFTADAGERNGYVLSGRVQDQGVAFRLLPFEGPDLAPLYRLALPNGSTALGIMTVPGYVDPRGPIDKTLGLLSIKPQPGWVSLYEWYHPRAGLWFYTTDPRGETAAAIGYRYQRVVGYVLPAS
jgi:hypothetical protein